MKKFLAFSCACLITAAMTQIASAQDVDVNIDGMKLNFYDAQPFLDEESERVFVPVRAISEQMQMDITWDEERKRIIIENDENKNIIMEIGNPVSYVNGEEIVLDAPPFIKNGRTFIPLRFVTENYGCKVNWNSEEKTAYIDFLNNRYAPETISQMNSILKNVTGGKDFTVEAPRENSISVSVADFGASPEASAEKNSEAFDKAVEEVKKIGATRLDIPKGVYNMRAERGHQVVFKDIKDLWIEGNGSELIFLEHEGKHSGAFFYLENCERVKIHDLAFDTDDKIALYSFLGTVKSVNIDACEAEFKTDMTIPENFVFDGAEEWDTEANNKVPSMKYQFPKGNIVISQEKTGEHTFKVKFKENRKFKEVKEGDPVYIRFKPNFKCNGINSYKCKNLSYDHVTIYSSAYQAFYTDMVENFEYNSIKVIPRKGRRFSTFGGCETHQVLGNVKLVDSEFQGVYDDVMHMSNSFFATGSLKVDDHTIILDRLQHYQSKDYLYKGATLSLRTEEFEPLGWESEIEDFEWQMNYYPNSSQAHRCIVKFKDPLPETYNEKCLFFNDDFKGLNYIIRNNTIKDCSCHAFYYGLGNGTIENNTIENTAYPAIVLNTVLRWRRWCMGFSSGNVIIRNNHIIGCDKAQRDPSILFVGGGYDDQPSNYKPVKGKVTKNVLIENNTIENSIWAAFGTFSSENIVVRNNRFINNNLRESRTKFKGMGNCYIYNSDNVVFAGNINDNNVETYENGLFVDEFTTNNITIDSNIGFGDTISLKERTKKLGQQFDSSGNLIVDSSSFEYSEGNGTWSDSYLTGYGKSKTRQSGSLNAECKFNPLLEGGKYKVYVYLVNGDKADENVTVKVMDKNGITEKVLDCGGDGDKFVELGEFEFNPGKEGWVMASRSAAPSKIIRISAVKFKKLKE